MLRRTLPVEGRVASSVDLVAAGARRGGEYVVESKMAMIYDVGLGLVGSDVDGVVARMWCSRGYDG